MFYTAPFFVPAIYQSPTDVQMGLQLSMDPEVVYVEQELRTLTIVTEDRTAIVPEELRRVYVSGDDIAAREVPRLRRT